MKITGLGSVLALRFGVEAAQELVPDSPVPRRGRLARGARREYQAAKRAYKSARRERRKTEPPRKPQIKSGA